jgi:hypothetical protein
MFVATAIACATLPGTVELGLLTLGAFAPRRKPRAEGERSIRQIAIVIPAHDEEKTIGSAVASLLACDRTSCAISIHVIADNCTDDTAGAAVRAGARLIERHDTERRGKGHALAYAFERVLEDESVDAILVIDADSRVDANFLSECEAAFARGSHAIQAGYQIGNPEASDRVRLVAIAFRAFNVLRPRARSRLGLSCGILGNGFGLARATVERVPYTARSVVEDLEYHLELVKAGLRVDFLEGTTVRADQPLGDAAEKTQRARWEGGRFRMIREHAPKLLAEVVRGPLAPARSPHRRARDATRAAVSADPDLRRVRARPRRRARARGRAHGRRERGRSRRAREGARVRRVEAARLAEGAGRVAQVAGMGPHRA